MKTNTHDQSGLSLVEVLFIVVTVALVAAALLPMLIRPHRRVSRISSCTSNLKQIGLAYRLFSNDHDDKFPFAVPQSSGGTLEFTNSRNVFLHFQAMSNELVTPKVLICRTDTNRQWASDFSLSGTSASFNSNSNLSYFVGLDADEAKPERILSGDRNITGGVLSNGFLRLLRTNSQAGFTAAIHNHAGNIGLADGSVQPLTPRALQWQLQSNTLAVIRLAIP